MDHHTWLSIVPPIITIAIAVISRRILPALLSGLLVGSYLLNPTPTGGFETTVDYIVKIFTDGENLQVFLFLYLFSGLIALIKHSGGIKAFSDIAERHVRNEKGVFFILWALIPVTFIDCGFRVVGAGAITNSLAEKNKIAKERLAFMLSNTASPVVELIPIATTFVGFNIANIHLGLVAAKVAQEHSAYAIWLKAIPLEFFSLTIILITLLSVFLPFKPSGKGQNVPDTKQEKEVKRVQAATNEPVIHPRVINLILPLLSVISLSIFFFWFFGKEKSGNLSFRSAMADSEPNRAMLVALFITIMVSSVFYLFQKYRLKQMTVDLISGGNEIMATLSILALAWPLAAVSQDLGLNDFIQQSLGHSLPGWSIAVLLFTLSSAVTYFTGSGWGAASLIMPFAIPLAVSAGVSIQLCVAAVISGGTFGDVTSPLSGLTNMSANIARVDLAKYLKYANPYNFIAAGVAAALFLAAGIILS